MLKEQLAGRGIAQVRRRPRPRAALDGPRCVGHQTKRHRTHCAGSGTGCPAASGAPAARTHARAADAASAAGAAAGAGGQALLELLLPPAAPPQADVHDLIDNRRRGDQVPDGVTPWVC
jgi:hypothetical protein